LDLVVFGRRAGQHIGDYVNQAEAPQIDAAAAEAAMTAARAWIERLTDGSSGPHGGHISDEMQTVMMEKVGIYRNADEMQAAVDAVQDLRQRYQSVRVQDRGKSFNTDLLEVIELANLLDLSLITAASALNRQESRGAHSREDFEERDDEGWLKHTLAYLEEGTVRLDYKPVDTSIWAPKPRTY
jgi:succinate dehydrogenase / fumarate reductase flavoprotein subunit